MVETSSRTLVVVCTTLLMLVILAVGLVIAEDSGSDGAGVKLSTVRIATLANRDILESSGLALSMHTSNVFWTHNDSGDTARLFAFDAEGRDQAVVSLRNTTAKDWEDIASLRRDGKSWLLVGDVGDNGRRRESCQLLLVPEPRLDSSVVDIHSTINFRYEDGPKNCEGIGVDGASGEVLLVTKEALFARVYILKLPAVATSDVLVAKRIAQVSVPLATGMDVSQDGTRAIVVTYANAFEFVRRPGNTWKDAFRAKPQALAMPARRQGESICYGSDSRTLYLTSERTPTPLWKVERSESP